MVPCSVQQHYSPEGIREVYVRLTRIPRVGWVDFTNPMGCIYLLPTRGSFYHTLL